jgi:hypothetical protein
MPDLDIIAPQFRLATERWPDAPTLANHYKAVVECYAGTGHSLIASVKSFIECICLTLLGEFGKTMPTSDPSTTELLVEALKTLGLQNSRGASKIDKILSAHNKMADALNEMIKRSGRVGWNSLKHPLWLRRPCRSSQEFGDVQRPRDWLGVIES